MLLLPVCLLAKHFLVNYNLGYTQLLIDVAVLERYSVCGLLTMMMLLFHAVKCETRDLDRELCVTPLTINCVLACLRHQFII